MIKIISIVLITILSSNSVLCQSSAHTFSSIEHEDLLGRCTGSATCKACRNCSKCAHCNRGGSCGVCKTEVIMEQAPKKNVKKRININPVKKSTKLSDNPTSGNQIYVQKKVTLKIEKVDLRKGPAANFPVVGTIYKSQKLICISNVGNWAKIQTDKGTIGFVKSDLIKISNKQ